MMVIH